MKSFFKSTPLEEWYAIDKLKSSRWPRSHASDILRYTSLWKYGGTYVDLDVVLLRSLKGLSNFAGAESPRNVAAGMLSFTHGHPLSDLAIREIRDRFKGYFWGYNGPQVITRALKKYCAVSKISKMTKEQCGGFTVFPPKVFYPIYWNNWRDYFSFKEANSILAQFNESLAVHLWNKFSQNEKVIVGSGQPYDRLAAKFCPRVYSTLGGRGNTF
ncbi:lactosylceramide 4-alpha-galactosyltransferase-like isoform X2 [Rhodnius prolixus]